MVAEVSKISIIVPAHNEEENLVPLLAEIEEQMHSLPPTEVVLVCDHCTDNTQYRASTLSSNHKFLKVIVNDGPKGMGNALKKGAASSDGDILAFVMADVTCPLSALRPMLDVMAQERCDMVIFSRYVEPGDSANLPLRYRIWSRLFRIAAKTLVGIGVNDITDAFRVIARSAYLKNIPSHGDFSFSSELTFRVWLNGFRICEFPGRQRMRTRGKSSFSFHRMARPYTSILLTAMATRIVRRLFPKSFLYDSSYKSQQEVSWRQRS